MKQFITILAVLASTLTASANYYSDTTAPAAKVRALTKKETKQVDKDFEDGKIIPIMIPRHDTLEVFASEKVKFIKIGGAVYSTDQLTKAINLPVSIDWILAQYQVIETSSNSGLKKGELDQLEQPLIPYVREYQRMLQQREKK